MLTQSFQSMAAQVEGMATQDQVADSNAELLVRVLTAAHEHDIGIVRAFANGCDENPFAEKISPIMPADRGRVREALCDIFNGNLMMALNNWAGITAGSTHSHADERFLQEGLHKERGDFADVQDMSGVHRFLECRSRTRECRQLVF